MAVVGNQLVPTLAAQKETAISERQAVQDELAEARFELQQSQFEFIKVKTAEQLRLAQEDNNLAQQKFINALVKNQGLQPSEGFYDSAIESEVRGNYVELFSQIKDEDKVNGEATTEDKSGMFRFLRKAYSPQQIKDKAIKQLIGIPEENIPSVEETAEVWLNQQLDWSKSIVTGTWSTKTAVTTPEFF